MLRREGVPDMFDFKGACIFITNLQFSNLKSKKLQDHLEALAVTLSLFGSYTQYHARSLLAYQADLP
jgi:hypothetical protein